MGGSSSGGRDPVASHAATPRVMTVRSCTSSDTPHGAPTVLQGVTRVQPWRSDHVRGRHFHRQLRWLRSWRAVWKVPPPSRLVPDRRGRSPWRVGRGSTEVRAPAPVITPARPRRATGSCAGHSTRGCLPPGSERVRIASVPMIVNRTAPIIRKVISLSSRVGSRSAAEPNMADMPETKSTI